MDRGLEITKEHVRELIMNHSTTGTPIRYKNQGEPPQEIKRWAIDEDQLDKLVLEISQGIIKSMKAQSVLFATEKVYRYANPDSKMDIPSYAYEQMSGFYDKWKEEYDKTINVTQG